MSRTSLFKRALMTLAVMTIPWALAMPATAAPGGGSSSLPKVSLSSATYSVGESGGVAVITLKRTAPSKVLSTSVSFLTSPNTATEGAGNDYTDADTTVVFSAKQTTATVNVFILPDTALEGPETVNITLGSTVVNGQLGSLKTALLTIVDDETAGLSVNDPVAVTEGAGITFTVTLAPATPFPASVSWTASSGTAVAPGDFASGQSGAVAFAPGETSKTFSVTTADDALDEADGETMNVTLSAPSAGVTIADGSGVGTMNDNDSQPTVYISNDPSAVEGASLDYTITLSAASGMLVSGTFETWPGNAADTRYTPVVADAWSIPAGSTSTTVSVPTNIDGIYQGASVTVWGHLTAATNATITVWGCLFGFPDYDCANGQTDAWSAGSLSDDETMPTISVNDPSTTDVYTCAYAGSYLCIERFTVTLSGPSAATVTVNYATADDSATAGSDYTAGSGTVTFLAGDTSESVDVSLLDTDFFPEANETFFLNLTGPSGATISDSQGVGTIVDFDGTP